MFQTLKGALYHSILLPPAKKVCEGYVFTRVCHSVHRGGCFHGGVPARGVPVPGGSAPRGVPTLGGACSRGGVCLQGVWRPPLTATVAGGTHPTGMHSCI